MCSAGMLKSVKHRAAAFLFLLACFALGPFAASSHGQESEAATRQFAVAVGFQNQKLYDSAIDEWQTFLKKFDKDPRVDKPRTISAPASCRRSSIWRPLPRLP